MNSAGATLSDPTFLRGLLLELAAEARSRRFEVAPNPCVGAAVLAGRRVVGRGYHEYWGGPHAELNAIAAAWQSGVPRDQWDTLVVTLEPCSTHGKTPPCTEAIRALGIARVVAGARDPDPRQRGGGLEALRAAGLEVDLIEATPVEQVTPHFARWTHPDRLRRARPWTIAKWAQTRTGQLVPPPGVGEGRWISGPQSLAQVQVLRSRVDAIVTGVTTVLRDDPRLSVRLGSAASDSVGKAPARVILDSFLRTPVDARLFADPGPGALAGVVHVLCQAGADAGRHRALMERGVQVTSLHSTDPTHISLRELQEWLWKQGWRRVLLESGPELLGRYLEAGFVDQLRVYTGNVAGGEGESMAQWFSRLRLLERRDAEVGVDQVFEAFVSGADAG
jgi:diaminohydroxyphosphoribosylaminopyrimidine deaminase/5-amino-6-(5-phosphoribosylamino)uracil reductase